MSINNTERIEFGFERTECNCRNCRRNCMYMPGFLIPDDLWRMIPNGSNPFLWAESNLLASPGALVMKNGKVFRIPTLVPATKPDGSCIHYGRHSCAIWQNAPFGCAFFDCGPERGNLSQHGLKAVYDDLNTQPSMYYEVWKYLWNKGKRQQSPDILRARMTE